ncbi:MAG: CotH kinase family protein [Saprospiraceae bacterium]
MHKLLFSCFSLLTCLSLSAQTFSSSVNQPIPDDGTIVTFDIPVSGLQGVIDTSFGLERFCINMTHTYTEDMTVKLKAPNGYTIMLFGGVGGGGDDFINTCLEGTGPSLFAGSPPFTGTFQCMGQMGNMNKGQDPNGTWTLILYDTYAFADEGFLIDWSITFGNNPARPFVFPSSNLPIVKLTTINDPIGDDPKVPVLMQIIDNGPGVRNETEQTEYAYEGLIMTEWQGFTGPYYPKKNYDFELVDSLGNQMDTTILGMPKESDWIFKAEYLDPTLLKNSIAYEMARRMGGYAPRTRSCEIVLDGEYIGMYVLTEKVKRDDKRVDIAKLAPSDTSGLDLTGGYIIEMNINNVPGDWNSPYLPINSATCGAPVEFKHVYPKSENLLPQQRDYIRAYVDTMENALLAPGFADPDTGYRQYLDVDAFIDFLIVNEFSVNYDSYGRSTYLVKEKDNDGGKLKCGPPWDYDRAMDFFNPGTTEGWVWEITHPYWPFPFWWSRMWQDDAYRKQLACRWTMLRQNTLQTEEFMGLIDSLTGQIDEAQERNFRLWNTLGTTIYHENINSLKSYMVQRLEWIDATLAVEQVAAPMFYLPSDTLLCAGSIFDAEAINGQQYTYNWQPGPDTSVIRFPQDGLYHLLVTDAYGCYGKKDINIVLASPTDAGFSSEQIDSTSTWTFLPDDLSADTYLWDFGDGNTSMEQNPLHHYVGLGAYVVSLTTSDSVGCPAQTQQDTIQFLFSSTFDPGDFAGIAYPNPFREKIQIDFAQPLSEGFSISLENVWGQAVTTAKYSSGTERCTIATEDLPAGVYWLRIRQGEKAWVLKMLRL